MGRRAQAHGLTCLGAISDAISYQPPLYFEMIQGGFEVLCKCLFYSPRVQGEENGSNHSMHKAKQVGPQSTQRVDFGHKGF